MGNRSGNRSGGRGKKKRRGRQRKPASKADKAKRRRDGLAIRRTSSKNRNDGILIKVGNVGRYGRRLAVAIGRANLASHPDETDVVRGHKSVIAGNAESVRPSHGLTLSERDYHPCILIISNRLLLQSLNKLLKEVSALELLEVTDAFDQAWCVKTKGTCGIHVDHPQQRLWSFLCCVRTDRPYLMEFAHVVGRLATEEDFEAPRKIKMTTGDFVIFPACIAHRCVADPTNTRTIINTLARRPH